MGHKMHNVNMHDTITNKYYMGNAMLLSSTGHREMTTRRSDSHRLALRLLMG